MGLIYKELTFTGGKASKPLTALMDTGASLCFIREEEAAEIGQCVTAPRPLNLELGKGMVTVTEMTSLFVDLDGQSVGWMFYVLPGLTEQVIIGADFFQRWKIKLDPVTEEILVDPRALKHKLA